MRNLIAITCAVVLNCLIIWVMFSPWYSRHAYTTVLVSLLFATPALGTYWMLYIAIRNEKQPLPFALVALLPYAFLWYYFDRVTTGRYKAESC